MLREKPFCLNDEAVAWVEGTLAGMTLEEKVGQLFCVIFRQGTEEEIASITSVLTPGGAMYGIVEEGTLLGAPLEIAATDDPAMAARLGTVCGREGSAVGANWAFAPIVDIDTNLRNPITNT